MKRTIALIVGTGILLALAACNSFIPLGEGPQCQMTDNGNPNGISVSYTANFAPGSVCNAGHCTSTSNPCFIAVRAWVQTTFGTVHVGPTTQIGTSKAVVNSSLDGYIRSYGVQTCCPSLVNGTYTWSPPVVEGNTGR